VAVDGRRGARNGKPLGVGVHDHIIVGKDGHASLVPRHVGQLPPDVVATHPGSLAEKCATTAVT
jgi:hypothetical protein